MKNETTLSNKEIEYLNNLLSHYYVYTDDFPIKLVTDMNFTPKKNISQVEAIGLKEVFIKIIKNHLTYSKNYDELTVYTELNRIRDTLAFQAGALGIINDYEINERFSFAYLWIAVENNSVYIEIVDNKNNNSIIACVL